MPFNRWVVKTTVVHPYHGLLLSGEEELTTVNTTTWVEGTKLGEKCPFQKGTFCYDSTSMLFQKRQNYRDRTYHSLPSIRDDGGERLRHDCQNAIIHLTVQPLWGTKGSEKSIKQSTFHIILQYLLWQGKKKILQARISCWLNHPKSISGITCALSFQVFLPELRPSQEQWARRQQK